MIDKHDDDSKHDDDTPREVHDDFTDGRDVRSDPATIRAIREGAAVQRRISYVCAGDEILPVTVAYDGDGSSRVAVMDDAVAEFDRRAPGPRHRAGVVDLHSLDAVIAYTIDHARPSSVGFLDARSTPPRLEMVLDYHPSKTGGSGALWCRDRAAYKLEFSRQWRTWIGAEEKQMSQTSFSDFIEENLDDIGAPTEKMTDAVPAAALVSMARNLAIHSKVTFERSVNPNTGENAAVYKDEHDTARSTKIHRGFVLGIPVFEGAPTKYPIVAHLRFRVDGGKALFSFVLRDRQQALEQALDFVRSSVESATKLPVYAGAAPAAPARP